MPRRSNSREVRRSSSDNDDEIIRRQQRFSNIALEPCTNLPPIEGYEEKPGFSLEDAVQPLVNIVHGVERMASIAKEECENIRENRLSLDQAAALRLYTMESQPQENSFYYILNETLRKNDRNDLNQWIRYLQLIRTALNGLLSEYGPVYCGAKGDLRKNYSEGKIITCQGFISCASSIDVLENAEFLGSRETRTLFSIESTSGKNIRKYSRIDDEDEILLPPGRQFHVGKCDTQSDGVYIIHLKEIASSYSHCGRRSSSSDSNAELVLFVPIEISSDQKLKPKSLGKMHIDSINSFLFLTAEEGEY